METHLRTTPVAQSVPHNLLRKLARAPVSHDSPGGGWTTDPLKGGRARCNVPQGELQNDLKEIHSLNDRKDWEYNAKSRHLGTGLLTKTRPQRSQQRQTET